MSDNASSTNKTTPAVFYAQKTEQKKASENKQRGKRNENYAKSNYKTNKPQGERRVKSTDTDSRIETFKPRDRSRDQTASNGSQAASPWKSRFRNTEQLPSFDEPISTDDSITMQENSFVDDRLKRQRKEETYVYGDNSCKAVFKYRPQSIVKAFLTQDMTHAFKAMIAWLVEHRLGYDVISDEEMAKVTQTPHHGGICLIIKKRQAISVVDYLAKDKHRQQDCILAIDDVNNPHNLGGMVRTAAFFNVNGILLRQTAMLESGAALRVAEGGAESLSTIKSDDFIASLDLLKQHGYQIVVLLPYKTQSITADTLSTASFGDKVVFAVSQQLNSKLAQCADNVVYWPGSEAMTALNISVLTGVLLAQWQEKKRKR